jgi:hypothetical protein
MSIHQKLTILMKGQEAALLIDDRYWNLFELFGQEIAEKFKQRIYETRGRLGRRLTIPEVDEIYQKLTKRK